MDQTFVDVCSTFIENIFRSGLTLVSSNDIIAIKIDKKNKQTKRIIQNKNFVCKMYIRESNSDYEMEKDNLQIFTLKKNVLRQLLFFEIVSSQRFKTNCLDICV